MSDEVAVPAGVVPLSRAEHAQAGGVLGRAFYEDALWAALLPDPEVRRSKLPAMFSGVVKMTAAADGLPERTGGFEAVGLWLRPGRDVGAWAMLRATPAMARWVLRPPFGDLRRIMAVLGRFEEQRKRLMPDPHWYLMAIGADPAHQGHGHGSTIMRAGISRADREGAPIYLEAESAAIAGFYERHGFDVLCELAIPESGLAYSLMAYRPLSTSRH